MSRLGLSTALLVLLGTLMAGTLVCESCKQAQDPRPAFCLDPPYGGDCKALLIRYFYNASSRLCETFVYGGCDGRQNNFLTSGDCRKTCGFSSWPSTLSTVPVTK
ncbi:serum basic protease inhibitor-like [Mesoplodon densirostris]|uniref:serum basic protease inhibitor-like n=1 Tax=Mesoplodon densirostris TaxID=48708 RepID=UPI0028DC7C27|nr:serum basic protease inhibitor-like [Mesoplodon densirostris]